MYIYTYIYTYIYVEGGRGHRKVRWSVLIAVAPCTDGSQLGTEIQMPTVWQKFHRGASQKGHSHSHPPPSKQEVSRYVLRVWWSAGDGMGPSSFTKRGRGLQFHKMPMLRGGFDPHIHVKASGNARQRYLPAVRWKVWRPKTEGDIWQAHNRGTYIGLPMLSPTIPMIAICIWI